MAVVTNKEVLQSYIMTTAKYDFSVYEKRIIYRLVELAQSEIEGVDFRKDCRKIQHTLFGLIDITLPIKDLLGKDEDKNYARIKDALIKLKNKSFEYEDDEVWQSISLVAFPNIQKRSSTISFTIHPKIWDCMLDFSKGYRKYELITAMKFESVYAMRFYELLSGQTRPLTFDVESLKERFCIQDKYPAFKDFRVRVLDVAKRELDEKSPYSFEYVPNKIGRRTTSITLHPFKTVNQDPTIEQQKLNKNMALSWDFDKRLIQYLKDNFSFETKEIKMHRELFLKAQNNMEDFIGFLARKKAAANRASNPKGYIINAIKGELEQLEKEKKHSKATEEIANSMAKKFKI